MKPPKPIKGKLYITFGISSRDIIKPYSHTEVFHGVRIGNVQRILDSRSGREIIKHEFVENKLNRQMRIHNLHSDYSPNYVYKPWTKPDPKKKYTNITITTKNGKLSSRKSN